MSRTVRKIGPILDLFTAERPEWGASEIAEAIGVPRSSAHTLLTSLVEIGLLRSGDRGRYLIGWRSIELADGLVATSALRVAAAPVLESLAHRVGETVHLAVLHQWRALQIDAVPGRRPVTVVPTSVGSHVHAHSTAVGKVLLAQVNRSELRGRLRAEPLVARTPLTRTAPDAVLEQVDEVRARGFAVEIEENEIGLCGVAAPIMDDAGPGVAALGAVLPVDRYRASSNSLIRAVSAAADETSIRLVNSRPGP